MNKIHLNSTALDRSKWSCKKSLVTRNSSWLSEPEHVLTPQPPDSPQPWAVVPRNRALIWRRLAKPSHDVATARERMGSAVDHRATKILESEGSGGQVAYHTKALQAASQRVQRRLMALQEDDEDREFLLSRTLPSAAMVQGAEMQRRRGVALSHMTRHRLQLGAASYSPDGRIRAQRQRAFLRDSRLLQNQRRVQDMEDLRHAPRMTRRDRARARRVASEHLWTACKLAARTQLMQQVLWTKRKEKEVYLLRTLSAMRIQKWYRRRITLRYATRLQQATTQLQKFIRIVLNGRDKRRRKRSADIIKDFIENYARTDVSKLIRIFKGKIVRMQRIWRGYVLVTAARLELLKRVWLRAENRINRRRHRKRELEAQEAISMEHELMVSSSASTGLSFKIMSLIKKRPRRATKGSSTRSLSSSPRAESGGAHVGAVHLLHTRTQETLKLSSYRDLSDVDEVHVDPAVRDTVLLNLLRKKREEFSAEQHTMRLRLLTARRERAHRELTREDVRLLMHASEAEVRIMLDADKRVTRRLQQEAAETSSQASDSEQKSASKGHHGSMLLLNCAGNIEALVLETAAELRQQGGTHSEVEVGEQERPNM